MKNENLGRNINKEHLININHMKNNISLKSINKKESYIIIKNKNSNSTNEIKAIAKITYKINNKYKSINNKINIHPFLSLFFLILVIIFQTKGIYANKNLGFNSTEITMKVNYIGRVVIIWNNICPNETYINGTKVEENKCLIYSTNKEDLIKLVWFNDMNFVDRMFSELSYITEIDLSKLGNSRFNSTYKMFYKCHSLKSINFTNFDTSKVTDMGSMFEGCFQLNPLNITNFNTSNVVYMGSMFSHCVSLKSLDISNFNTSKVSGFSGMFEECYSLTSINISSFNTSNVISLCHMFYGCKSLIFLDLSNFDTSKVINMEFMFKNCNSLRNLEISNFNTSLVYNMYEMFYNCYSLESLNLSNFNTSKITYMAAMFYNCNSLKVLDISNFDTSKVTKIKSIFNNCNSLKSLDVSKFNISLIDDISYMFHNCNSLISLNLLNFNTSLVLYMSKLFYNCSSLTSINLSNFNFSLINNIYKMFYNCNSLRSLNLSNFDTSRITDMQELFYNCSSLKVLDLSNFDTSKVTSMAYMFYNCNSITSLKISSFNTSGITNMYQMFYNCSSLQTLDISNFDFSRVDSIQGLFCGCISLSSLKISYFNARNSFSFKNLFYNCFSLTSISFTNSKKIYYIGYTNYMFYNCTSLKEIDLSIFDTEFVMDMSYMFFNCTSLKALNLSHFESLRVKKMECVFCNCENLEYINLKSFNLELFEIRMYDQLLNMFNGVPENIVYCTDEPFYSTKLRNILKRKKCSVEYCLDNWKEKQKKMILINNTYVCEEQIQITNNINDFNNSVNTIYINDIIENTNLIYLNNSNTIKESTLTYNNIIDTTFVINKKVTDTIFVNNEKNNDSIESINNDSSNNQFILYSEYITNINSIDTISIYSNITSYNSSVNINSIYSTDINEKINYCEEKDFFERKCNDCFINILDIYENNITKDIISKYKYDYTNITQNYINNNSVIHYINNDLNYSITIFNTWYCTNLLLKYGYFEINPIIIFDKINNITNKNKNYFLFTYINKMFRSYIEIYDIYEKSKIKINKFCPQCFFENNLIIKNNFTKEIISELGKNIIYKIIEFNIDPFDKSNQIFNNICKNFTIASIDIPLKERKQIIYLGIKDKEIICNDINCDIEKYFLSNLTSICNCKISDDFNYLLLSDNNRSNNKIMEEYNFFINSKSNINNFNIFKCGKEAFLFNEIRINTGFYISIIFLTIQIILSLINIIFNIYLNNNKPNPPKIKKFTIEDDFEDSEDSKDLKRKESLNDKKEIIEDNEVNIYIKKKEKIDNKVGKINNIYLINSSNVFDNKNIKNNNDNKQIIKENSNQDFINIFNKKSRKKRSIKNLKPIPKNLVKTYDYLINQSVINKKEENIKTKISKSFCDYYWTFLSKEQLIINMFFHNKLLKLEISFIPLIMKTIRIIFVSYLNIFFNIFFLAQNYFRKKYIYFNNKYCIKNMTKKISLNERFKYGFKHTIFSGLLSFIICFFIQLIINYIFFSIDRDINKVKNTKVEIESLANNKISNLNKKEVIILLNKANKRYLIFLCVNLIIMIFISYSIITFNEVYRGGISDLISGTFWAFLFSQILPLFYCLIFALIKYLKNKNNR